MDYIKNKQTTTSGNLQIDVSELVGLFKSKASYTKDYEEKLFEYDKYTAITTAGAAEINSKRVGALIQEIKSKRKRGYGQKKIETKIKDFCDYLTTEVKAYLNTHDQIGTTSFIITHFNKKKGQTIIYRVTIEASQKTDLQDPNKIFVTFSRAHDIETVVCDGTNRIAQDILFGKFLTIEFVIENILKKIATDLKMSFLPTYEKNVKDNIYQLTGLEGDFKIAKLKNLSLQQAVDLANLLMKIEMDFQKYTEDIPTVGGVIKIAIIDSDGFKFIAGHEVVSPMVNH